MLIPSILRMLDSDRVQLNAAAQPDIKAPPPTSNSLREIEIEIAAAAELVKPSSGGQPATPNQAAGPFLEELIRAVTKFEKPDQSRVVDVFE